MREKVNCVSRGMFTMRNIAGVGWGGGWLPYKINGGHFNMGVPPE